MPVGTLWLTRPHASVPAQLAVAGDLSEQSVEREHVRRLLMWCGDDWVEVERVQAAFKKEVDGVTFCNGYQIKPERPLVDLSMGDGATEQHWVRLEPNMVE